MQCMWYTIEWNHFWVSIIMFLLFRMIFLSIKIKAKFENMYSILPYQSVKASFGFWPIHLSWQNVWLLDLDFLHVPCSFATVETLWESHKIWKNHPPVLTNQLLLLSSVKTCGRFFQIFVAFSEKLNFNSSHREYLINVSIVPFCIGAKWTTNKCCCWMTSKRTMPTCLIRFDLDLTTDL